MTPAPVGVEAQLAVINTKLDAILASRDDHETRIRSLEANAEPPEARGDQENRLRKLEQFRWVLVGAAGIAGAPGLVALLK